MDKISRQGLTFDDILLVPAFSSILPRDTDLHTYLTRTIRLNIPLVSAAMDTVTEARLAIAVAREGGIGFIHKNLPVRAQADQIRIVKRSESVVIDNPFSLPPNLRVREAVNLMRQKDISGVPITKGGKLVGILTNRDLRFQKDLDVPIASIMTPKSKLVTATEGTTMEQAEILLHKHRIEKLPVVDRKGKLVGLITVKDILMRAQYPNACKDRLGHLRVGAAVGVAGDTLERVAELVRAKVDVIAIDTAHGHSAGVLATVRKVKQKYPELDVVAGNVATYRGFLDLAKAGVDCVKVGMGPGSICTTRVVSGAGVPQVTAILDCRRAAEETGVPLIADGGLKFSGDLCKAIACGADCCMIGNLLAGTEEAPGELILYEGRSFKSYRGMGSLTSMKRGSKDRYFQEGVEESKLVPEGIEGRVPYKGPVASVLFQLVGGLRVGMGYCGCKSISELKEKTEFIQITSAGVRESHPHTVTITQEAPNYKSLG